MADMTKTVVMPGEWVVVCEEDLECRVEQVSVRMEGVVFYEVSYWRQGEQRLLWLHSSEVEPASPRELTLKIGFVPRG